jgi:hypothetical protein
MVRSRGLSAKVMIPVALLVAATCSAAQSDSLLVSPGKVGPLVVGMNAVDVWKVFPRRLIRGGFAYPEGIPTPVLEIRMSGDQKGPSLILNLDETADHRHTTIRSIGVLDVRFKMASGIGPGSLVGILRSFVAGLVLMNFEADTFLSSENLHMSFDVDGDDPRLWNAAGDFKSMSDLPAEIKVTSIWVGSDPKSSR